MAGDIPKPDTQSETGSQGPGEAVGQNRNRAFDLLSATPAQLRAYLIEDFQDRAQKDPSGEYATITNIWDFLVRHEEADEVKAFLGKFDPRAAVLSKCKKEGVAAAMIDMWMPNRDKRSLIELLTKIIEAANADVGLRQLLALEMRQKAQASTAQATPPTLPPQAPQAKPSTPTEPAPEPTPTEPTPQPTDTSRSTPPPTPTDVSVDESIDLGNPIDDEEVEAVEAEGDDEGFEAVEDNEIVESTTIIPEPPNTKTTFAIVGSNTIVSEGNHLIANKALPNAIVAVADNSKLTIKEISAGVKIMLEGNKSCVSIEGAHVGCKNNPAKIYSDVSINELIEAGRLEIPDELRDMVTDDETV
ncbi:hypothetical protein KKA95_04505 [Patescibacteria group bacterium]|nr:hypothetical protein [Patescibacteria group bacterium]